jgi:NAD(P)-dependent dehydrogenase (short-subunit alcohol dehydrogenase family)
MHSFRDRVVLITGAASGIGREVARLLAAEGARIAALDIQAEALDGLVAELKGRCSGAVADVTDLGAIRAAVARLEAEVGPTDLLLAGAGIGGATPALDFHAEDFAALVRVNLIGVANTLDAVLPGMRARRRGHLAALSSLASFRGLPRLGGYSASKAGLNALLDALRVELAPLGITVTTICPGWVRTPMTLRTTVPPSHMMEVEEAGRCIVAALRARRAFVAFPSSNAWRVRLLRHLPLRIGDWMAYRLMQRLLK